jgi:hypothetical protein
LGPSPFGLVTIFYCLRFETSLFVASYDSQGHGGGIRPRLQTRLNESVILGTSYNSSARTPRKKSRFIKNVSLPRRCLVIDVLLLRILLYTVSSNAIFSRQLASRLGTSFWRTTRCYIPEDNVFRVYRCKNLKSYIECWFEMQVLRAVSMNGSLDKSPS